MCPVTKNNQHRLNLILETPPDPQKPLDPDGASLPADAPPAPVEEVVSVLKRQSLGECLRRRPPCQVLSFDADTSVSDALRILGAVDIKSAPVFDTQTNAFLGFVDSRDVLALVLDLVDVRGTSAEDRVHRLWLAGKRLEKEALRSVWPMHDGELVHSTNERRSVFDVLRFVNGGGRQREGNQVGSSHTASLTNCLFREFLA